MYIDSTDNSRLGSDQGVARLMRTHIEPLFRNYSVDFAVYGHNHASQRHSAAFDGRVCQQAVPLDDPCASDSSAPAPGRAVAQWQPPCTVHYVAGNGGAGFTRNAGRSTPEYTEAVWYVHGAGALTAHNRTHLQWRMLAGDQPRVLLDDLWLIRAPRPACPATAALPGARAAVIVGAVCGALAALGLAGGLLAVYWRGLSRVLLGDKFQAVQLQAPLDAIVAAAAVGGAAPDRGARAAALAAPPTVVVTPLTGAGLGGAAAAAEVGSSRW